MVAVAEQLRSSAGAPGSSSVSINVNAGGIGVGIATFACLVMLVATGFMAWMLSEARSDVRSARTELREHGHQLNAIYRVAPSIEREVRARLEEDARLRQQVAE